MSCLAVVLHMQLSGIRGNMTRQHTTLHLSSYWQFQELCYFL